MTTWLFLSFMSHHKLCVFSPWCIMMTQGECEFVWFSVNIWWNPTNSLWAENWRFTISGNSSDTQHSGWGEIPLSAGIWSQAVGGTSQVIWRLTSASRPVMWSSSRGQGDANCSPGQGNMSSQVDNDDTPLSSSRASVPSSSTKHSSNEAKQSSSGPGHPLSFVEIQSFEKIWQLDRVN